MSPRLLFLLATLHAHHPLERERDRIDARLAATRMSTRVRRLFGVATPVPAGLVLFEASR
jgi:hypothetical protein